LYGQTKPPENNFGDGMHILTTRKIEDNLHMSPAHCSNRWSSYPPQLPVLQVKWFFNLVTNSCSSCCGCWNIIIIIIIISWREKGCGFLSLHISPIFITVGPGFLQQRKEILGLASKKIVNQSINQSIHCVVEVSKGLNSLIH
jgi:hypothetical protein